jgi:hypothetical protein
MLNLLNCVPQSTPWYVCGEFTNDDAPPPPTRAKSPSLLDDLLEEKKRQQVLLSPPPAKLKIGQDVVVRGLVSKSNLNGQVAVIESFDSKTGRFNVCMVNDFANYKIKEPNLAAQSDDQRNLSVTQFVQDFFPR